VVKTEPADDNNQDVSSLIGKVDIRKLKHFPQNDPDAYLSLELFVVEIKALLN